jgi:hypothetical protein
MQKFEHPYINNHFDFKVPKRYLIIGTFPPNPKCAERSGELPFFYGNVNSLWSIIKNTGLYPDYTFTTVNDIKKWLDDYEVGVTDVLKSCSRANDKICSTFDTDLVINDEDLDDRLKKYIINNQVNIEKIFFTSGSDVKTSNSAYYLFKTLMGSKFVKNHKDKLIKLPSPSGNSNTSLYRGKQNKFGLIDEFYTFLSDNYPDAIIFAEKTWQEKMTLPKGEKIRRLPDDRPYSAEFKTWFYKKYLQFEKK